MKLPEGIHKKIEKLREHLKRFSSQDEAEIRREIKELYIELANAQKNLSKAQDELKRIVQEFRKKRSSQDEVSRFYSFVKSRTSAELDIATLLDRAWNLICMDEFGEALQVLKKVLDIDPKHIRALGFTALCLMNTGAYDEAMLYLQKVLVIEPENPFALNILGYICYKKGIWGEAIEHLTKARKQIRDRTAAMYANYYLGLVYLERSMFSDAIRFFKSTLEIGPNFQDAYYYLGIANTRQYEFKTALEYFNKCNEIDKNTEIAQRARDEAEKLKILLEPKRLLGG